MRTTTACLLGLTLLAAPGGAGATDDENPALAGDVFRHDDWTTVLQRFVDERGFVDYRSLARDRAVLDRYLRALAAVSPDADPGYFPDRDHELAYWLNAYNATTVDGVLEKGPDLDSVWGWTGTGFGFFVLRKLTLGGVEMSPKKLEDDVVRRRYGDARIHAALNCASAGCPELPREAFRGPTLDAQLDQAMTTFVNEPHNLEAKPETETVWLNKIFDWYRQDFTAEAPSLIAYVNRYKKGEPIPEGWTVRFFEYDKSLNDQR